MPALGGQNSSVILRVNLPGMSARTVATPRVLPSGRSPVWVRASVNGVRLQERVTSWRSTEYAGLGVIVRVRFGDQRAMVRMASARPTLARVRVTLWWSGAEG